MVIVFSNSNRCVDSILENIFDGNKNEHLARKNNPGNHYAAFSSHKEVLDFVLLLKSEVCKENDSDYLSNNPETKQAIIDGLNTPLDECSEQLDW
jgi:hypothetical protein